MSIRTKKIADLIRDEISLIIQRKIRDERIGFLSVTEVVVTPDLSEAFVYVSILGDPESKKKSMKGIRSAAKYIRMELGKKIQLRITPKLIFREDESLERGSKIIEKLNILKQERKEEK
ncbi:30S ribosome-binding factor RbfA [Candidatus Margulisiibacteriota bacterium]